MPDIFSIHFPPLKYLGYPLINTGIGADRDVVMDILYNGITAQYFTGGSYNAST